MSLVSLKATHTHTPSYSFLTVCTLCALRIFYFLLMTEGSCAPAAPPLCVKIITMLILMAISISESRKQTVAEVALYRVQPNAATSQTVITYAHTQEINEVFFAKCLRLFLHVRARD